jgi:signal transduction histidine kinase
LSLETEPVEQVVNILLVDDQPENILVLRSTLEALGQNLLVAHSGREALRHVLNHDCALIILDVVMPDLDGFETAQLIRERESSRQIPIVFLTAGDRSEARAFRGYSVGAVDYIHKPFHPEVMRSKASVFVELAKKTELVREQSRRLRETEQREHERQIAEATQRHQAESYRIRGELLVKEMEAAKARAALELAEARSQLLADLERKNVELDRARTQAERESRFKSTFLAGISHELRTPLNGILGFSEMLQQEFFGPLNAMQKEHIGLVVESGRHLLALVNDVLDISKLEAGRMELALEPTTLASMTGAALETVRPLAEKQGVTLELDAAASLPIVVVDPVRIRQVLYNLLSNAIKFTRAGGRVLVRARKAGEEIEIVVEDTGVGIRPEDMPRLFREFEQIEPERFAGEAKPEGTGLGLAVSKRLVELHRGSIAIESRVNEGTTVSVRIPLARTIEVGAATAPEQEGA